MDWLVLKNRRHEGPFSEDALREACQAGRFKAEDYAVTVAQFERGDFDYTSVRKVLGLSESVAVAAPSVAPPRTPPAKKRSARPLIAVAAKPAALPVAPVTGGSPIVPQAGARGFSWRLGAALALASLGAVTLVMKRPASETAPARTVGSVEAPRPAAPRAPSPHAEGTPSRAQRATEHVLRVPKISDDAPSNSNLPPPMNAAYPEPAANADSVAAAAGVGSAPETNAIDAAAPVENDPNAAASAVNLPHAERTIASPLEGQYFQPAYVPNEAQPR